MRVVAGLAAGVLAVAATACRSPFADADESGPPEDPQRVGVGVHGWPLYERAPGSRGVRTDVLWPLASVRTSPEGTLRRADVLIPIVLWEEDGTRSRFGVRPLFDVETDDAPGAEVEDVDLLFPLVKWRESPRESRFELRPFWWSRCTDKLDRQTLFPFWGRWTRREVPKDAPEGETPAPEIYSEGWFLWPFGGTARFRETTTDWWASGLVLHQTRAADDFSSWNALLGAFERATWDDGSESRVFPLFSHERDDGDGTSDWTILWPGLAGSRRKGDAEKEWVAPFWYGERDATSSTAVVFPFWFQHDDESEDERLRLLFPLYGTYTSGEWTRTMWGGNLFVRSTSEHESAVDFLWPLFHAGTDASGWDARAFPLLWIDRHPARSHTHLWPLFGHRSDGTESEVSVAWPFFTVETDDDGWEANLPAPLVEIDRRGDHHETRVFPLFYARSEQESGEYDGNVLWRLCNWEGDGAGRSDFRILWRLVQDTDTGDRHVFAVNPLFRHESNDRGDVHWSTLFGLVARTREAEEVSWRLLWFITF